MNFHTKLIGALDAVILTAVALVTIGFTDALLDPPSPRTALTVSAVHEIAEHA